MKTTFKFLIAILGLALFSCSKNPAEPTLDEIISGAYQMSGTQIEYTYQFPWPQWGGERIILRSDTSQIEFTLYADYLETTGDTIRFRELIGANAGEWHALPPAHLCSYKSGDCADARYVNNTLEMHYVEAGGTYDATGTLENGKITLNAHFEYRATGIDYILEGMKVEK